MTSDVTCEVRSETNCEVGVMIELHRNRNIFSDINAKCQYFITHVLNHYFFDESRGESGGELSHQLCADIHYDRDAKCYYFLTIVCFAAS